MERKKIKQKLEEWFEIYKEKSIGNIDYKFDQTASTQEIQSLEQKLKENLPAEIKTFFFSVSREIYLNVDFNNNVSFGKDGKVSSAYIALSLNGVYDAECSRKKWVEEVFFDTGDDYSKKWHNKFGIMSLINGDIIAMDLEKQVHPIIYLSHDDGEGHGYILGRSFEEYLKSIVEIGGCGTEDEEFLQFCTDNISGIDLKCTNIIQLREKLRLGKM